MRLFSYVVARDYGFAPNPFHGWCTLATCKPKIRAHAAVGDWILGTGSKSAYDLAGHIIFAMRVDETCDFTSYWNDPRFARKRPVLNGSLKQMYGDNIYRKVRGKWRQADSHHSLEDGCPNPRNINRDTSADRVLLSCHFVYFGENAPKIPKRFRPFKPTNEDVCHRGVGHHIVKDRAARALVGYLERRGQLGLLGFPLEFPKHQRHATLARGGERRRRQ